jgi:oligopeptide/dipeptide ABC transporter ATP-binding protein
MGLVDLPGRVVTGEILFKGMNLLEKSEREMQRIRGKEIAMIWQDPMASLNPVRTIGAQIAEALSLHQSSSGQFKGQAVINERKAPFWRRSWRKREIFERVVKLLEEVNIPDAVTRAQEYPHQLSGGMQQRVMIAMALACEPSLLIADEPTTALDVTIQVQILELLQRLQQEGQMAILLITHNLGIVAEMCHRVQVMYAGQIVESTDTFSLFAQPSHPYTQGLLRSIPRPETRQGELESIKGMVPDLREAPTGCAFQPRCPAALPICKEKAPALLQIRPGHAARCHLFAKE